MTGPTLREIVTTTARNRAHRVGGRFTCFEMAELFRCGDQQNLDTPEGRNTAIDALGAKFKEIEGRNK